MSGSTSGSTFTFATALATLKTFLTGTALWECIGDTDSGESEHTGLEFQAGTGTGARTVYFRCPGYDDLADCYFAIYSLNSGSSYFTLAIRGMEEYIEGYNLAGTISGQPYASSAAYMPCNNTSASYYLSGDERKFTLLVNVGGRPQMFGGGLFIPSGPPTEYPKPMFVGGSIGVSTVLAGSATAANGNKGFFSPGSSTNYTLYIFRAEGVWTGVSNYGATDSVVANSTISSTTIPITLPYISAFLNNGEIDARAWGSDEIPIFPISIYLRGSSPNRNDHFGELDGVYWISGGAETALAVEDVVVIDTFDHIVWHHPILSDQRSYCVMKMY